MNIFKYIAYVLGFAPILLIANPDELVAAVLVAEARGEGKTGMAAVMSVIDTRAGGDPHQYMSVIMRPKQFSCLNFVTSGRMSPARFIEVAKSKEQWQEAYDLVKICRKGFLLDLTGGADHYHNKHITPNWADESKATIIINNHIFYKLWNHKKTNL